MNHQEHNTASFNKKYWPLKLTIILAAVFCFVIVGVMVTNAVVNYKYANVYLPGTRLGHIDIGSLTYEQAKKKTQTALDGISKRGFVYTGAGKNVTIYPIVNSGSADSAFPLVIWQAEKTLDDILKFQKDERFANLLNKIAVMLGGKTWDIEYTWDRDRHLALLKEGFVGVLSNKKEASFSFDASNNLLISPENSGQTMDYARAMDVTEQQVSKIYTADIKLEIIEDRARVTSDIINKFRDKILATSQAGDLVVTFQDKEWGILNKDWREFLSIKFDNDKAYLGLDTERAQKYFTDHEISSAIEIPVRDAKFKLDNGRVSEFMSSQEGQLINWEQTIAGAEKALASKDKRFAVAVETVKPKVMNGEVNDLGIGTLLGTGESNFKGSPPNRIHNIGVGAGSLNGLLINPGEEFSLITALGEIDGEHGYKEELVIKGDKTTPEFGGGLCQIGTTVFRAALKTGLPIKERRNRSYRVVYYEPAGMDATIYDPKPDLKFLNDTGHYILVQSRIEGTKLFFDFWGTADGRTATTTMPIIYNQVSPPPKKEIKTTDLKPGQKKCTESPHAGADTKFDYIVQYPNSSEVIKETFYSHYIPWQEVCLIGATQEEIDAAKNGTATSTPTSTIPTQ